MAKKANTIISADDKTRGAIESAKKGMRGYGRTTQNQARLIAATTRGLKTAFIAMGVAVVAAVASGIAIMTKAVRAANEQEAAEVALTQAIGRKSQALFDDAAALQQVTIFGDEQTIKAQALIGSFVKEEEAIKAATRASMDLAAAKGFSLVAAADLVSKTLGSSTNALTRYGIAVTGAVGSTERLTSLTENIAAVFGGQAQAQALTFGGSVKQLSNAVGDLWEELGFLITRNSFFIDVVKLALKHVQDLTKTFKDNRAELITMAQTGIIAVVKGLGSIVEAARFVSNAWNGIKLVGNLALMALSVGIEELVRGFRVLLLPLDLIFQGLVKIGKIDVNPFDTAQNALADFSASTKDIHNEIIADIVKTNKQYDGVRDTINGIVSDLENLKSVSREVDPSDVAAQAIAAAKAAAAAAPAVPVKVDQKAIDARAALAEQQRLRELELTLSAEEFEIERQIARDGAEVERLNRQGATKEQINNFYRLQDMARTKETEESITKIREQEAAARLQSAASLGANLVTIGGSFGKAGLAIQKALAIRSTIIETWRGAQQAFSSLAGIPIIGPARGIAAAAAAVTAGFIRVRAITSESKSSGGGGGGGRASISGQAPPSSAVQAPPSNIPAGAGTTINISISTLATDKEGLGRVIADVLKEATGDGFDSGMTLNVSDAEG